MDVEDTVNDEVGETLVQLRRLLHTGTVAQEYVAIRDPSFAGDSIAASEHTGPLLEKLLRLQLGCKTAQIILDVRLCGSSPTPAAILRLLALLMKVRAPEVVAQHARNVFLGVIGKDAAVELLHFYQFFVEKDKDYPKGNIISCLYVVDLYGTLNHLLQ